MPDSPRVLLVNPNSSRETTAMMTRLAGEELAGSGLEVVGLTTPAGPRMIVDPEALAASAEHVRRAVLDEIVRSTPPGPPSGAEPARTGPGAGRYAAVVVAAVGDPARAELDAECPVPVVGIGQASIAEAAAGGRRFGMATSTPLLAGSLAGLVAAHGCAGQFTGVALTEKGPLELARAPEEQFRQLRDAVLRAVHAGAEAVIVAGGPLGETARRLRDERITTVVEPVPSACRLLRARLAPDP